MTDKSADTQPQQHVGPAQLHHPYVSERTEGKPWFEWCVAAAVVLSAVLAVIKLTTVATVILSLTSLICATVRLVLREKSPWKVRGVLFDCIIGYAFGIGLAVTYVSILLIS